MFCIDASKLWLAIVFLYFFEISLAEEKFRVWTNVEGKSLEAKFLKRDGEKIDILDTSGRKFTIPISRFSKEDKKYVLHASVSRAFDLPEPFPAGQRGACIIMSIKGKVEVRDHYANKPARVGKLVTSDKTIITGGKSSVILIFTNGTSAYIGPNTKVFFQKIWQKEFNVTGANKVSQIREETSSSRIALELRRGDLVVDVKKLKKDSSLLINSPGAAVGIRGTKFGFFVNASDASVGVVEGTVLVRESPNKTLKVSKDQMFFGGKQGSPKVEKISSPEREKISKILGKIKSAIAGYSVSQLRQHMFSVNQSSTESPVEEKKVTPERNTWFSHYMYWFENPEAYGGTVNLGKIKYVYDQKKTELSLRGRITDVSLIVTLKHLKQLSLRDGEIANIKPLAKLTNLSSLHLNQCKIGDITPLEKLTNLTDLNLYGNQIRDIEPLSKLLNLKALHLASNKIEDISPLRNLLSLTSLSLHSNKFRDISPLLSLTNLKSLELSESNISESQKKLLKTTLPRLRIMWIK